MEGDIKNVILKSFTISSRLLVASMVITRLSGRPLKRLF